MTNADHIRIMKSYVWHDGKCFFVSTQNRESSVPMIPPPIYAETIVWEYDWDTGERGDIVHMGEDGKNSAYNHLRICSDLWKFGRVKEGDDD